MFLATLSELVNDENCHYVPRFASAGDDGLVLVWNVEVMHAEGIMPMVSETTPNTNCFYFWSDRRKAAGAERSFPADNSHNHLHH